MPSSYYLIFKLLCFIAPNYNLGLSSLYYKDGRWINCLQIVHPWLQEDYEDLSVHKETSLKEMATVSNFHT